MMTISVLERLKIHSLTFHYGKGNNKSKKSICMLKYSLIQLIFVTKDFGGLNSLTDNKPVAKSFLKQAFIIILLLYFREYPQYV